MLTQLARITDIPEEFAADRNPDPLLSGSIHYEVLTSEPFHLISVNSVSSVTSC
jgi:hypothetical protein